RTVALTARSSVGGLAASAAGLMLVHGTALTEATAGPLGGVKAGWPATAGTAAALLPGLAGFAGWASAAATGGVAVATPWPLGGPVKTTTGSPRLASACKKLAPPLGC